MIALKTIASGSPYFAVNVRMSQSYASTEFPLKSTGSPVFRGSELHDEEPESFAPPSFCEDPLLQAHTMIAVATTRPLPMQRAYRSCARSCTALHAVS